VQTQFDVGPHEPVPGAGMAPLHCGRCGTEVTTAWAYCEICGASIRIEELAAALTPVGVMPEGRSPRDPLALASIVLAVLWIGGVGSVLAVLTGWRAKSRIGNQRARGKGLAAAGIALGVAGLVVAAYLLAAP
jgi:hypothetical protein